MKAKSFLFILVVFIGVTSSEVHAQNYPQPVPNPQVTNPPNDWLLKLLFNNKFRIGGVESGASTYGYSFGIPVIWAADQLKIVPTLGRFWQPTTGWAGQAAIGGRVLYYFKKQDDVFKGNMNPYAGGFSIMQGSSLHNSGIAIGIQPHLSRYLKLGFEIQAGLRSENGEDRAFGGAAITIGFGW